MNSFGLFVKKHKLLVGVPLMVLWFIGLFCSLVQIYTWWGIITIVLFYVINVLGWVEIIKHYEK